MTPGEIIWRQNVHRYHQSSRYFQRIRSTVRWSHCEGGVNKLGEFAENNSLKKVRWFDSFAQMRRPQFAGCRRVEQVGVFRARSPQHRPLSRVGCSRRGGDSPVRHSEVSICHQQRGCFGAKLSPSTVKTLLDLVHLVSACGWSGGGSSGGICFSNIKEMRKHFRLHHSNEILYMCYFFLNFCSTPSNI